MKTLTQLRQAFWLTASIEIRDAFRPRKTQNSYNATVRSAWCEFVDAMARDGSITEALAGRATL